MRQMEEFSPWALAERVAFRFTAAFLLLFWLTTYGLFAAVPVLGARLEASVDALWQRPVLWVGSHVFHLTGIAAQIHETNSRDTALNWIAALLSLAVALIVAMVWSLLDRDRKEYATAALLLRYVFRLLLIYTMLRYAIIKMFPLQMSLPSLAVLNERVGDMSPMTLLWTTLGLHPAYEMTAGWLEGFAALLLMAERTALIGALLTVMIMTNVLLYNIGFDVPVKLGAFAMLLGALAVAAPDARALGYFLLLRRKTAITSRWTPKASTRTWQLTYQSAIIVVALSALVQFVPMCRKQYAALQECARHPTPFTGVWNVARDEEGTWTGTLPSLAGTEQPITALICEPTGITMARASDGSLWRTQMAVNRDSNTLTLASSYSDGEKSAASFSYRFITSDRLVLSPSVASEHPGGVLTLVRVQLPSRYPLLEQKMPWVHEWALER